MSVVYKAILKGKLAGQDQMNRIHFMKEVPADNDKAVLAQHIIDRIFGQWTFLATQGMQWQMVEVYKLGDQNDSPLLKPTVVNGFGLNGNNCALPIAAVLQIKTAVGGKTGRGRIYLPGQPSQQCENGVWSPFWLGQMNSVCQSHKQWFGPNNPQSGFHMCLAKEEEGIEFKIMTDIVPRNYPGTQVRRNFKRGR